MKPEEVTATFATAAAAFPKIVGQPTDDDLTALREILYPLLLEIPYDDHHQQGAAAVDDDDADNEQPPPPRHNLIGLIESTASYVTTYGAPFPIPNRPPAYPNIANNASAVARARSEAVHAILVRDFATYEAAERATAKFIRDAVDEIWYRDLRHARSFYNNVTAKQLIDHLDENCGGLHPSELVNLPTEMMTYYAKADGIPEYIDMLEEAQRKLARANLPMSNDQLLAIASTAVLASEHYPRPTDEWESLPRANKTWTAWKQHYRSAHLARKRQMMAAGKPVFGGVANAVTTGEDTLAPATFERLDNYLDNLASAATTERTTLTQLVENNASLTASVAALTASVTALTSAHTLLANNRGATAPPTQQPREQKKLNLDPNGYCWTHGYRVKVGHTSATCTGKRAGHQDAATRANPMGGSTYNMNNST